jgi:hypothetical protein
MRIPLGTAIVFFCAAAFAQEKLQGTNIDARLNLSFKAPEAAVQKMLPDGWEINPPGAGPAKGANLFVNLIEQVNSLDAQGTALEPSRGIVIAVPAKKKGAQAGGAMVVGGLFTANAAPGAYGVYMPAKVTMERRQRLDGDGKLLVEERWSAKGPEGHAIEVEVQYVRGMTAKGKAEMKVYSGARPDFYRIYRIETASDVARSADGTDRVISTTVRLQGHRYAGLVDGQKPLSVTAVPSYSRAVYLPGP